MKYKLSKMAVGQKEMARQVRMNIVNEHIQRAAEFLENEEDKKAKERDKQRKIEHILRHPVGLSPAQMNRHEQALEDMNFDQFCVDDTKKEIQQWEDCKRILRVRHAPKKYFRNLERQIRRTRKTLKFFEGELRTGKRAVKDIVLGQ
jgi:hypothetical protein